MVCKIVSHYVCQDKTAFVNHDGMDEPSSELEFHKSDTITYLSLCEKLWSHTPRASGSYGRPVNTILKTQFFKIIYRLAFS